MKEHSLKQTGAYIPPFRVNALTPLYDFVLEAIGLGRSFKREFLGKTTLRNGQRVLDMGCGTGVLSIEAKKLFPGSKITGIDPDEGALDIARRREDRGGVSVQFIMSGAEKLPFPDKSFDVVISTLAFHHMPLDIKRRAAKEAFRVLKSHGIFYLFDFKPRKKTVWNFWTFIEMEHARDNYEGKVRTILREAGFKGVRQLWTKYGMFELLVAERS